MKEIGPIVVALVLFAAILLALHSDGNLFNTSSTGFGPTKDLTPNKGFGSVQGAKTQGQGGLSPFAGDVDIDDVIEPGTFAGSEYLILTTSTKEPINITGWSIVSDVSGSKAIIGNASNIPLIEPEQAIMVNGYQKVIINSGKSPIDISFRTNICTGYLEYKTSFYPKVPLQCPYPTDGNLPDQIEDSATCMNYLNSITRCKDPTDTTVNIPSYCRDFVDKFVSHKGCVDLYKNSKNFYGKEWRVFLKSNLPLWRRDKYGKNNQESLRLLDAQGRLVDTFTY